MKFLSLLFLSSCFSICAQQVNLQLLSQQLLALSAQMPKVVPAGPAPGPGQMSDIPEAPVFDAPEAPPLEEEPTKPATKPATKPVPVKKPEKADMFAEMQRKAKERAERQKTGSTQAATPVKESPKPTEKVPTKEKSPFQQLQEDLKRRRAHIQEDEPTEDNDEWMDEPVKPVKKPAPAPKPAPKPAPQPAPKPALRSPAGGVGPAVKPVAPAKAVARTKDMITADLRALSAKASSPKLSAPEISKVEADLGKLRTEMATYVKDPEPNWILLVGAINRKLDTLKQTLKRK